MVRTTPNMYCDWDLLPIATLVVTTFNWLHILNLFRQDT